MDGRPNRRKKVVFSYLSSEVLTQPLKACQIGKVLARSPDITLMSHARVETMKNTG